jgi:hypothetical protein
MTEGLSSDARWRSQQIRVHLAEAEEVCVARGSMGHAEPEVEQQRAFQPQTIACR